MVLPIPDPKDSPRPSKNGIRKRKRKLAKKKKQSVTMSSFAGNFAAAATSQLHHEVAFWKAKAISLEYENKILHDIVRQNCIGNTSRSTSAASKPRRHSPSQSENDSHFEEEGKCEDEAFEVSEEYIQFLKANKKFKDDARRERERLRAKKAGRNEIEDLEAGPSQPTRNKNEEMNELYGSDWQKIVALEMCVQSHFMHESDKGKPMYWPNIPLNFG